MNLSVIFLSMTVMIQCQFLTEEDQNDENGICGSKDCVIISRCPSVLKLVFKVHNVFVKMTDCHHYIQVRWLRNICTGESWRLGCQESAAESPVWFREIATKGLLSEKRSD